MNIVRVYNLLNRLRKAIRAEGTPRIQSAWDDLEPHVSIFLTPKQEDGK